MSDQTNDKEWTIMIYMAGDNNLSVDMAYTLEQIKSVTSKTDKINLFVYFDGYSSNVPTLYCDFSEPDVVQYHRSFMIEDKLIKRGRSQLNENSASVNNVINFVDWCVNKVEHKVGGKTVKGRRAKKYAMIFSGHSFGFQSQGLFKDEKADYYMTLSKLRWMFERITFKEDKLKEIANAQQSSSNDEWDEEKIKERTTEILGQELSILGFDSCVMSMMEIGCQFKDVAETLIASEGTMPNAGWSYAQMLLGKIATSLNLPAREIAASFVETFIRQQNKFSLADISVDLAAWDLKKLGELENSVFELVQSLLKCFEVKDSISYKQMKRILIQVHWQCQTYLFDQNIDIGDFCHLLSREIKSLESEFSTLDAEIYKKQIEPMIEVGRLCDDVSDKIKECVILCGFSGGSYQFSNGISLFFPWSWTSYEVSRQEYESLSFVELNKTGKKWNEFLQKYLSEVTLRKAKSLSKVKDDGSFDTNGGGFIVYKSYFYADEINSAGNNATEKNGSENKIPINGTDKIPINGTDKIPINGTDKIPINGTDKLFNALSLLFSKFMVTKNIESFWNHSGFTAKGAQFVVETKKDEFTSKVEIPGLLISVPAGDQVFTTVGDYLRQTGTFIKNDLSENLLDLIKNHSEENDLTGIFNNDFINKVNNYSQDEGLQVLKESIEKITKR